MPQNYKKTDEEFNKILSSKTVKSLDLANSKYVILSDIHLGDGGRADDFVHNEHILMNCLEHYKKENYKLILLGDIEDFWQVKPDDSRRRYNNSIYKKIREYGDENVFRIFGNHDIEWSKKNEDYNGDKTDPAFNDGREFGSALDSIKFINENGKAIILLMHGHQGSVESQMFSWISKPFVWFYGKVIEPIFGTSKLSAEPNTKIDSNYEQVFYKIALEHKVLVIAGHSHYAIFASLCYADILQKQINELQLQIKNEVDKSKKEKLLKELEPIAAKLRLEISCRRKINPTEPNLQPKPCYFNTGCCLYTSGITCIELEDDHIRLQKWDSGDVPHNYGEGIISDFYAAVQ